MSRGARKKEIGFYCWITALHHALQKPIKR